MNNLRVKAYATVLAMIQYGIDPTLYTDVGKARQWAKEHPIEVAAWYDEAEKRVAAEDRKLYFDLFVWGYCFVLGVVVGASL